MPISPNEIKDGCSNINRVISALDELLYNADFYGSDIISFSLDKVGIIGPIHTIINEIENEYKKAGWKAVYIKNVNSGLRAEYMSNIPCIIFERYSRKDKKNFAF